MNTLSWHGRPHTQPGYAISYQVLPTYSARVEPLMQIGPQSSDLVHVVASLFILPLLFELGPF